MSATSTATDITGELLFGFIEENANLAGTVGGRFINATLTVGQTVIVPQGVEPRIRHQDPHHAYSTLAAVMALRKTGFARNCWPSCATPAACGCAFDA